MEPLVGRYFMSVTLGYYCNSDLLKSNIKERGKKLDEKAGVMLQNTPVSHMESEVDLYVLTLKELGIKLDMPWYNGVPNRRFSLQQVLNRAQDLGFQICSAECAPLARIKSNTSEWLLIGMQPVNGAIFWLCSWGNERSLDSNDINFGFEEGNDKWIFVWPKA